MRRTSSIGCLALQRSELKGWNICDGGFMATLRLTQDFKEFLKLLNSTKIEYLLIGGYAVCLYGHMRPTKDIDFWVGVDAQNHQRLVAALREFGFSEQSIPNPLFRGTQTVLRMGVPPNRIEILSEIAGVQFTDCWARRQIMNLDGIDVPLISYEDLKRNKTSTGRLQDAADVQRLEKRRNGT